MIAPGALCEVLTLSVHGGQVWYASMVIAADARRAFCDHQRGLCCATAADGSTIMYSEELRPTMPDITWLVCP